MSRRKFGNFTFVSSPRVPPSPHAPVSPGVRNNTLVTSSIGMSRMVGTDPCAREEGESAVGGRREENGKETSEVPTPGKNGVG